MSAYKDLEALLGGSPLARKMLDALLNEHAHELAEKIRQETARLKADGVLEPGKFRPCRDAADQIDPEVTDGEH